MATIVKKIVDFLKNNKSISNPFIKIIYNFKYKSVSKILEVKDITTFNYNIINRFFYASTFLSFYPKFIKVDEKSEQIKTPEISLYKFQNILINADSSALIFNNNLVVNRTDGERYDEGFVKTHNNDHAKVFFYNIENLDEGFFLAGNGSWNWFHFIIEILPKLLLLSKSQTNVILVSDIILQIPSMQHILEIINEKQFEIKYLDRGKTYFVKNLYHINDFNHVQFNRYDGLIKAKGTYYNKEMLCRYSDTILNKITLEKKETPTKIFLYRKNTHRIAQNQDEILDYLKNFGFIAVCLEDLAVEEQIYYFKNAKFIVGISGAAWSNLIFCRNKPKAICFIPNNVIESTVFSNLAKISNVNMLNQSYESDKYHYSSGFNIDFSEFKLLFKTLFNEKK